MDQDGYTKESYDAYLEALNGAKELLKQDDIAQTDIDIATWNLKEAIIKLEKVLIDKSDLKAAIQRALDIEETLYTQESYQNLQTVLLNSQAVYENESATLQEVEEAIKALNTAMAALEKIKLKIK